MIKLVYMKHIYISGSIAYDEIMDFPGEFKDYFHPEKLHQINVSFAVSSLAKHLGGCATNIAYSASVAQNISFPKALSTISPVGAVGKDGKAFISFFKKKKIDASYVPVNGKLYTATGRVITDIKNNQIWGFYYGAAAKGKNIQHPTDPQSFWVLSATHPDHFLFVQKHCIKYKLPYLYDPGMILTWITDGDLKDGIEHANYLVVNDYEMSMIEKRLKTTIKEIVSNGVNVIVTLGEYGVEYYSATDSAATLLPVNAPSQNESPRVPGTPLRSRHLSLDREIPTFIIPAVKLKKIIDPTGAGDAWRGGFVAALVEGKPLKECLILGNVMASFAVETVGTVEYHVKAKELNRRILTLDSS